MIGEDADFLVTHGPDAEYQEARAKTRARVTSAVGSAAEIACARERSHAHTLSRRLKRLKRNARFAHGATRRYLRRRARHVARKLHAARAQAGAVCLV